MEFDRYGFFIGTKYFVVSFDYRDLLGKWKAWRGRSHISILGPGLYIRLGQIR